MSKSKLRPEDLLALNKAEDLISVVAYRVAVAVSGAITQTAEGPVINKRLAFLSVGEIDPFCDELYADDIAGFKTPEAAENARDKYTADVSSIGIKQKLVVVGVNAAGTILMIDGEFASDLTDEPVEWTALK